MSHDHACHLIWDLAGRPTAAADRTGRCSHCALHGPIASTIGPNFTDYRLLAAMTGAGLCQACTWVFAGKPPNTLRMWSLVARADVVAPAVAHGKPPHVSAPHLHLTNRRDLRWVAHTLADPPPCRWLVAVAESGQKHTAPFARVNMGRGPWTVRMDGTDITSDPDQWRHVLAHTAVLRQAGFSAAAVESGEPPMVALRGDGLPVWRDHFTHVRGYSGAPLIHLANYMITKETVDDYCATYPV